jgi:hypothetical protein
MGVLIILAVGVFGGALAQKHFNILSKIGL